MIPFPTVESQRGIIGIETRKARVEIRRPMPDVQSQTIPAVVRLNNGPGRLVIDQRATDEALTGGRPLAFWQRIYSQYQQVARENLQHIVDEGNRLGDLKTHGNPIPDIALEESREGAPDLQVFGEATPRNISFQYTPNDLNMQVERGRVERKVQTHRPEVNVQPYSVRIYMEQYPKLTITPPAINIQA